MNANLVEQATLRVTMIVLVFGGIHPGASKRVRSPSTAVGVSCANCTLLEQGSDLSVQISDILYYSLHCWGRRGLLDQ